MRVRTPVVQEPNKPSHMAVAATRAQTHTYTHTHAHTHTHTHTHIQKIKRYLKYRTSRSDFHKDRRPSKLSSKDVEMKGSCASSRAHPSRVLETIVPGFLFLAHGSGLNAFRERAHPPYLQHCLLSAIATYIRALETIAHGGRRHTRIENNPKV
jgi:hypothetical protein